ncbi:hypothetical protein FSP39_022550 [Pinctada imbricata]|uniref:Uncharacterized protein n=1 Tax=Pinctada imbricata TaxID=66713 RepID=A0AA88Y3P4_PINIB|nr:hypothetical protein FSP39_022550 [Pinctada imbricata]
MKRRKSDDIQVENMKAKLTSIESAEEQIKDLKSKLMDAETNEGYLQNLLDDSKPLKLYDKDSNSYTTDAVQCVMNLTNLKVPSEKVGEVIREVLILGNKTPNAVPSATTVNRITDTKLAVAHKQIDKVVGPKKNTTLYTDETKKYGKAIQTYIVTDEEKNSYILGLREMFNKSSQCTLDTLKEILDDINEHCFTQETARQFHAGYQILANMRDTMSDRASTEKAFNTLLEEFRTTILPGVIYNWEEMSDNERMLCSRMNNFFCGLHLLVGMADACEGSIRKFETSFLDGKHVGSSVKPELKRYHRSESGVLRLIRTGCKAFAIGEDEKNGVSLPWTTFLKEKGERNKIARFKHNRFNLVFVLGEAIFYHHEDISEFLDRVHGTNNDLLKAVSLDVKENLFLAGARSFGLISKFISGPLWRILESKCHILEMNQHYKTLVDFLHNAAGNTDAVMQFACGENTPFATVIDREDKSVEMLTKEDLAIDPILIPLLQALFVAIESLLKRMVVDHLPGGKFSNPDDQMRAESQSTMTHNKLPEFVFGQLDQLLRYRPNSTLLTNEAFLLYSHNKTREWLDSLNEKERNKMLTSARKEGKEIRKVFKDRLKEIERRRIEDMKRKAEELERKEKKRLKDAENMKNDICYYGLWQNRQQVEEGLSRLPTNEQRKAVESQLKFRRTVLKQKSDDNKIFNFSRKNDQGKYVKLTIDELKKNLLTLIEDTLKEVTTERVQPDVPLFVGKKIDHTFSDGIVYKGYVISVVPGFPLWYNVKYEGDEAIYAYNLAEDYKSGDVRIVVE